MELEINMKIIPDKLIFGGKVHEIFYLDKELEIDGFKIDLDERRRICRVILNGKHPNADPNTNELCLTEEVIGEPVEKIGFPMLYSFISTYNLDHCYFRPWKKLAISRPGVIE
jgi:hypothetical protein